MPIYISRGKFTTDAVKGMLAKPENREEAVANLFKSCGGKLIGWQQIIDCKRTHKPSWQIHVLFFRANQSGADRR